MANLQRCSRCRSEIDISFFGLNRKKLPYKTCDNCRSKSKPKAMLLKRSDVDFVDGYTNPTQTNYNNDWKTLFGVPYSTHPDFRSYLLSKGWQEVHDTASILKE